MSFPSEQIFGPQVRCAPQRSLLKAMGYTDFELKDRPLIGIASSWNTISPGHYNLSELADFVRKGIYAAGGTAVYVSSNGNDGTGDGSADKPFATLARAVDAADDGATIYVMSDLTMTVPPVSDLLQSRKKLSF